MHTSIVPALHVLPGTLHLLSHPFYLAESTVIPLYRWLKTKHSSSLVPTTVDKNTGRSHLNNIVNFEQWRFPVKRTTTTAPRPQVQVQPPSPDAQREPNLRARFIPLAQSRTSAVIAALDYLGQLSQRARYRYTDEEIGEIEAAISGKLQETLDAFRRGVGNRPGFQFRGNPTKEI